MSGEEDLISTHIEHVDVNAENGSNSEKSSDSGIETTECCSETFPASSDSETSPIKSSTANQEDVKNLAMNDDTPYKNENSDHSSLTSPIPTSLDDSSDTKSLHSDSLPSNIAISTKDTTEVTDICSDDTLLPQKVYKEQKLQINSNLTTSTTSLNEQNINPNIISKSQSRSAEDILTVDKLNLNLSDTNLDREQILSQFTNQKPKLSSVHKIPEDVKTDFPTPKQDTTKAENTATIDGRYPRIPKEILSQDIGSIVKNVHGIFSSVSGSLKYAYNQRSAQKPLKNSKPIPNGKIMNDIFEDTSNENLKEKTSQKAVLEVTTNSKVENTQFSIDNLNDSSDNSFNESSTKDMLKLQIETLERLLFEQRKENVSLRERAKLHADDLHEKDQTFKELEVKLDLMSKRVEQAEREKDAAVMRYASVECSAIEARRAAEAASASETAAKAEAELLANKLKAAHAEKHRIIQLYDDKSSIDCGAIEARRAAETASASETAAKAEAELLTNKLKAAHAEKHRLIQLYDDKCHEVQNSEREVLKVREDIKELEGRLKWTQSKLRMEMDAYKESSDRAEKLSQQVAELEASKDAAIANAADTAKSKQLESELKECRAALILCRHEKEELERRLSSVSQQLETCKKEKDDACTSLVEATIEVEKLKINNLRLEEEAAELAALRAKAALADTLSGQLQRESERASHAEESLASARALAETCARREAAALEHAAKLTQQHVATRHGTQQFEAKAQALSADNASLRERVAALESECHALQVAVSEETDRRNKENRVLARKVAELTEEAADANKKLEWEKGENGVLKKKHSSAIKELNRELQRTLKRCEQLEAKLPPPDAPSTRTGSITSLSSVDSAQTEDRLQNGHSEMPDIQIREPDRQALIERIVSLQRAAARRAERCEFLEEHSKQLTNELRNKSRLLRHMLSSMPAGAVASQDRDVNKKEIARLGGGAMAAVWGGDPAGMTPELSLEMNTRLQALLEDTLLKNITLKENMDTLGAEISRLKEKYPEKK